MSVEGAGTGKCSQGAHSRICLFSFDYILESVEVMGYVIFEFTLIYELLTCDFCLH